jgi:hypothetical protein
VTFISFLEPEVEVEVVASVFLLFNDPLLHKVIDPGGTSNEEVVASFEDVGSDGWLAAAAFIF